MNGWMDANFPFTLNAVDLLQVLVSLRHFLISHWQNYLSCNKSKHFTTKVTDAIFMEESHSVSKEKV